MRKKKLEPKKAKPMASHSSPPATAKLIKTLKKIWAASDGFKLTAFKNAMLADVKIDTQSRSILLALGLPEDAAPFLNFRIPREGPLPRVSDPTYENGYEQEGLEHLRMIGSDGSGNPICLDEMKNGKVVLLNHENDFETAPMNTSVVELIKCLAVYADWSAAVQEELGDDAWDNRLPSRLTSQLATALKSSDPLSFKSGNFWHAEVHSL